VYTISSSVGDLIVHVSESTPSLERLRVPDKLRPVSQFLRAIPGVPAAEVLFTQKFPGHFIVAQKKLPGTVAGRILIENGEISHVWDQPIELYEEQVEDIVATIHSVPIRGFGPLAEDGEGLRGQYDSWEDFLRIEVAFWMDGMAQEDQRLRIADTLIEQLRVFLERAAPRFPCAAASLISCDLTNASNILVDDGKVTGIVDWEWAMAADPAWEFGNMNHYKLAQYFSRFPELASAEAQKEFLLRVTVCQPLLWCMWAYSHIGRSNKNLYAGARLHIKNSLARFM
jgi:thiamine kinase-like enzyme